METLKPQVIRTDKPILYLLPINEPNRLAGLNNKGEFCLLTIDKMGQVDTQTIVPGFPDNPGSDWHSDPQNKMLWQVRLRGFYALDIQTKQTRHIAGSGNTSDEIIHSCLIDPEKKIFYIEVVDHGKPDEPYCFFTLYDFNKDEKIYKSDWVSVSIFPLNKEKILFQEYYPGPDGTLIRWFISDLKMQNKIENKLTKNLTKLQIDAWERSATFSPTKRMLIGTNWINNELVYYTIRWDEAFEEVKIEPIILQRYKDGRLDDAFVFSSDGNWLKTTVEVPNDPLDMPRLLLYHVGDVYPQGLSLPIVGGYLR